jgi:cytochrome c
VRRAAAAWSAFDLCPKRKARLAPPQDADAACGSETPGIETQESVMVCLTINLSGASRRAALWKRQVGRCALVALSLLPLAAARANEALAKKYSCAACHQANQKLVGPAWKDVAAKYGNGAMTPEQLAASIKKGSSGKWGGMAMPPQGQVPEADLKALSGWILGGGK